LECEFWSFRIAGEADSRFLSILRVVLHIRVIFRRDIDLDSDSICPRDLRLIRCSAMFSGSFANRAAGI
jgi:hypothetical protein